MFGKTFSFSADKISAPRKDPGSGPEVAQLSSIMFFSTSKLPSSHWSEARVPNRFYDLKELSSSESNARSIVATFTRKAKALA